MDAHRPFAVLYPGDGAPDNAVLRALGGAGVPVALAASGRLLANAVSRYCTRTFRMPRPEKGAAAVVDGLIGVARRLGHRPVLFLLHDYAVMVGARGRGQLSEHFAGHFLDDKLLDVCNRHDRTCAAASAAGVPAPKTVLWPSTDSDPLRGLSTPCVIKPVSKYVDDGEGVVLEPFFRRFGRKAFLAGSAAELSQSLERCEQAGVPVVVQEYIPGDITDLVTVVLYVADGRVAAHFTGRKLRQAPSDCGTCTYGESCDADDAAELAGRLVKAIGYHGIAEVEFKRDRRDGLLKLMELNPRATTFCTLAGEQDVNLPLMAYRHLTNGAGVDEPRAARRSTATVRWMDPYRDLLQSGRTNGRGRVSLLRWFGELRRADLLHWGGLSDPLPLLVAPFQGAVEWIAARRRPALRSVRSPGDAGYVDYWEDRARKAGLRAVMWSNEAYNVLVDARQKRLLDDVLGDVAGKKALDFCCGTGRLSVHLAQRGAEVVGIDLPAMVQSARQTNPHPQVSYQAADVAALDLPPESFDLILSVGTLPCICDTPARFDATVERLAAMLRPGGRLVAIEPFHVCPGVRRPLRLSADAASRCFARHGLSPVLRKPLLFLPSWLTLARPWWRAPRGLTSVLFRLGELALRVPGLGRLSDYKLFVLEKGRR